jgi:hypothetical protein
VASKNQENDEAALRAGPKGSDGSAAHTRNKNQAPFKTHQRRCAMKTLFVLGAVAVAGYFSSTDLFGDKSVQAQSPQAGHPPPPYIATHFPLANYR